MTETLTSLLQDIIGTYAPYGNYVEGELVYLDGVAGVDWPWVLSALLFIMVVWSVFRLIGVLFRK